MYNHRAADSPALLAIAFWNQQAADPGQGKAFNQPALSVRQSHPPATIPPAFLRRLVEFIRQQPNFCAMADLYIHSQFSLRAIFYFQPLGVCAREWDLSHVAIRYWPTIVALALAFHPVRHNRRLQSIIIFGCY